MNPEQADAARHCQAREHSSKLIANYSQPDTPSHEMGRMSSLRIEE
jgi:hypothetical protein